MVAGIAVAHRVVGMGCFQRRGFQRRAAFILLPFRSTLCSAVVAAASIDGADVFGLRKLLVLLLLLIEVGLWASRSRVVLLLSILSLLLLIVGVSVLLVLRSWLLILLLLLCFVRRWLGLGRRCHRPPLRRVLIFIKCFIFLKVWRNCHGILLTGNSLILANWVLSRWRRLLLTRSA